MIIVLGTNVSPGNLFLIVLKQFFLILIVIRLFCTCMHIKKSLRATLLQEWRNARCTDIACIPETNRVRTNTHTGILGQAYIRRNVSVCDELCRHVCLRVSSNAYAGEIFSFFFLRPYVCSVSSTNGDYLIRLLSAALFQFVTFIL